MRACAPREQPALHTILASKVCDSSCAPLVLHLLAPYLPTYLLTYLHFSLVSANDPRLLPAPLLRRPLDRSRFPYEPLMCSPSPTLFYSRASRYPLNVDREITSCCAAFGKTEDPAVFGVSVGWEGLE